MPPRTPIVRIRRSLRRVGPRSTTGFTADGIKAKVAAFAGPEWGGTGGSDLAIDAITHAKNAQTAVSFAGGAYHGIATAKEALATEVSQGIAKMLAPGQRMRGLGSIAKTLLAPVGFVVKGRRMAGMAVGRTMKEPKGLGKFMLRTFGGVSPEANAMTRKIVDLGAGRIPSANTP